MTRSQPKTMARGKGGKNAHQSIARVQHCIEKCLMNYMNKKEILNALVTHAHEDREIAEIVWQRLEAQNPEFFKNYNLMLSVRQQITKFNELLSKQEKLMRKADFNGMSSISMPNGSHISPTNESSMWCATQTTGPSENANLQQPEPISSQDAFGGGMSIQFSMQGNLDVSAHGRMFDVSPNMVLSQNSNMPQAMNGEMRETGPLYNTNNLPFNYQQNGFFEPYLPMGNANMSSSFASVGANGQALNDMVLNGDAYPFGFSEQIPENFILPEMIADFSDLLPGNYKSQFGPSTDANNLMSSHGNMDMQHAFS